MNLFSLLLLASCSVNGNFCCSCSLVGGSLRWLVEWAWFNLNHWRIGSSGVVINWIETNSGELRDVTGCDWVSLPKVHLDFSGNQCDRLAGWFWCLCVCGHEYVKPGEFKHLTFLDSILDLAISQNAEFLVFVLSSSPALSLSHQQQLIRPQDWPINFEPK